MIKEDSVVAMTYVLRDANRIILDASIGRPFIYLQGRKQIIPGLEKAMLGLKPGDRKSVELPTEQGYGPYNPKLKMSLPKEQFGENIPEPGRQIQLSSNGQPFLANVVGFEDDKVILDANHPLAGKSLFFEVDILEVREATPEELQQGAPAVAAPQQPNA